MKTRIWKVAVIAAVLTMIAVNALANILPINGVTTGVVADGYPIYFVPAGYVFSIWGLIYLGLLVFTAAQTFSGATESALAPVRPLFVLNCLANAAWIFCWHYYQLALSLAFMLTLLVTLILIYSRLQATQIARSSGGFRWTVLAPISLYLAWICVATIPNISALLLTLGWDGAPLSGPLWAAIMMIVAAVIITALAMKYGDGIPPLVLGWALVGIVVKFPNQMLMRSVGVALVVAMLGVTFLLWRPRYSSPKPL